MKERLSLVFSLLALVVALAAPVGAKVVAVSNPMTSDLSAGGYSIDGVENLTVGGNFNAAQGVIYMGDPNTRPSIRWGTESPITDTRAASAQAGSLFLEIGFEQESAWIKTGPLATDWRRLAFDPATP